MVSGVAPIRERSCSNCSFDRMSRRTGSLMSRFQSTSAAPGMCPSSYDGRRVVVDFEHPHLRVGEVIGQPLGGDQDLWMGVFGHEEMLLLLLAVPERRCAARLRDVGRGRCAVASRTSRGLGRTACPVGPAASPVEPATARQPRCLVHVSRMVWNPDARKSSFHAPRGVRGAVSPIRRASRYARVVCTSTSG